jgi:putative transposase
MARRRHTPEQIIRKLREADRLSAEGADVAEVARHLEVSEQTYHRWRNQFGGMKADDARRLKDFERENRELKQIVATPGWRRPVAASSIPRATQLQPSGRSVVTDRGVEAGGTSGSSGETGRATMGDEHRRHSPIGVLAVEG